MINVQKVKKGLGKCWKFFAAKPAQAASEYKQFQCMYCGKGWSGYNNPPTGVGLFGSNKCPATGQAHVWMRIG